jgi:hypothetical protein
VAARSTRTLDDCVHETELFQPVECHPSADDASATGTKKVRAQFSFEDGQLRRLDDGRSFSFLKRYLFVHCWIPCVVSRSGGGDVWRQPLPDLLSIA